MNSPDRTTNTTRSDERSEARRWQERMLPTMIRVTIGIAVFFFVVTLGQLSYLHYALGQPKKSQIPNAVSQMQEGGKSLSYERRLTLHHVALAAVLESEATVHRYELASVILMAHVWIRYLGFVTGMIMSIIGCVFILGRLQDPSVSNVGAGIKSVKVSLTSSSPGLVLAFLGTTLMIVTVVAQQETAVQDAPLYRPFVPQLGPTRSSIGGSEDPELPEFFTEESKPEGDTP